MYSWERLRVRVILFNESFSAFPIAPLSHEYMGEGVSGQLKLRHRHQQMQQPAHLVVQ